MLKITKINNGYRVDIDVTELDQLYRGLRNYKTYRHVDKKAVIKEGTKEKEVITKSVIIFEVQEHY